MQTTERGKQTQSDKEIIQGEEDFQGERKTTNKDRLYNSTCMVKHAKIGKWISPEIRLNECKYRHK